MWKNKICTLLGRISITIAFLLMLIFGFVELVQTNFVVYDAIVLKLDFWSGNLAQALWNLLIIVAFFVFAMGSIWKMKHRLLFWVFGIIYGLIGNLTLIFIIIDFVNGKILGVKLAMGIIIAFLLIVGAIFLLFIVSTVNQGNRIKVKTNKKKKLRSIMGNNESVVAEINNADNDLESKSD